MAQLAKDVGTLCKRLATTESEQSEIMEYSSKTINSSFIEKLKGLCKCKI